MVQNFSKASCSVQQTLLNHLQNFADWSDLTLLRLPRTVSKVATEGSLLIVLFAANLEGSGMWLMKTIFYSQVNNQLPTTVVSHMLWHRLNIPDNERKSKLKIHIRGSSSMKSEKSKSLSSKNQQLYKREPQMAVPPICYNVTANMRFQMLNFLLEIKIEAKSCTKCSQREYTHATKNHIFSSNEKPHCL